MSRTAPTKSGNLTFWAIFCGPKINFYELSPIFQLMAWASSGTLARILSKQKQTSVRHTISYASVGSMTCDSTVCPTLMRSLSSVQTSQEMTPSWEHLAAKIKISKPGSTEDWACQIESRPASWVISIDERCTHPLPTDEQEHVSEKGREERRGDYSSGLIKTAASKQKTREY